MRNKQKRLKMGIFILVLILLIINFIHGEINTTHSSYLRILNEFNNGNEWVPVIVEVNSAGMMEGVIASLSETEIRNIRRLYGGFTFNGEITIGGINKLVNNSNVRTINLEEELRPNTNESDKNGKKDIDKTESNWYIYIILFIILVIFIFIIFKIKNK